MTLFLLGPILSFFSPRLYTHLRRSGPGKGLGYLFYLTLLSAALVFFLCQFLLLPLTVGFSNWLIHSTPEMSLTSSGLGLLTSNQNVKITEPYVLKYPGLGVLYVIDTQKTSIDELLQDKNNAWILIGHNHIVMRNAARHDAPRVIDLNQAMEEARKANRPILITKKVMQDIAGRIQSLIIPVVLALFAPIFFIWKLLAALFYSLFALLFNLFRKEKLKYGSLFTISCFAISPVALLQALSFSMPSADIQIHSLLAFALTVAYLAFGILMPFRSYQ